MIEIRPFWVIFRVFQGPKRLKPGHFGSSPGEQGSFWGHEKILRVAYLSQEEIKSPKLIIRYLPIADLKFL